MFSMGPILLLVSCGAVTIAVADAVAVVAAVPDTIDPMATLSSTALST